MPTQDDGTRADAARSTSMARAHDGERHARLHRRRIAWTARPASWLAAGLSVSCSALVSLDGLTGGGADASDVPDATSPQGSDGGADASNGASDGPSDGASSASNDSSDALAEGDDAGTSFCASQSPAPIFCDDFDESPLPGQWSVYHQTGGLLTEEYAASVSQPRSLLLRAFALDAGASIDVAVRKSLSMPSSSALRVEMSIMPVQVDPNLSAAIAIFGIDFFDGHGNRDTPQLTLVQRQAGPTLDFGEQAGFADGGSAFKTHTLPQVLQVGAWTRVTIDFSGLGGAAPDAQIAFDGTPIAAVALIANASPATLQIGVGSAFVSEPSRGWQVRFDNVVLTTP